MDIFEKIDQIREKPEHIRRLYVWFFVAIFMVLILVVWGISLRSDFGKNGSIKSSDRLQIINGIEEKNKAKENIPESYENYYYQELNKDIKNQEEINSELPKISNNASSTQESEVQSVPDKNSGAEQFNMLNLGQ